MRISIFGLGYVGCVGMGCLAHKGHSVIGVELNPDKIKQINSGKPTIVEENLDSLIKEAHEKGLIEAVSDSAYAVNETSVSFITTGVPNSVNGNLNMDSIYNVAGNIGEALKYKQAFHVVVIRSTVAPGTNNEVAGIIENKSGKLRNIDFAVVSNPEFLREGSAVNDYLEPGLTVIGTESDRAYEIMMELYGSINSEFIRTGIKIAEIIKYVNNSYHALKIAFANEIGNICKALSIDSHDVMELFCSDKKLNISPSYLTPGYAYGGSCLPKDLKALNAIAHDNYINTPVLSNIEHSNDLHKRRVLDYVISQNEKKIGILGLSFKSGTDDLRNSSSVELVENLLGKGCWVNIYDKSVHLAKLTGTNKKEIERRIPKIADYISDDLDSVIKKSDLIIITYMEEKFEKLPSIYPDRKFIDLTRIDRNRISGGNYYGLSW